MIVIRGPETAFRRVSAGKSGLLRSQPKCRLVQVVCSADETHLAVQVALLRDERKTHKERFDGFSFTRFDGTALVI